MNRGGNYYLLYKMANIIIAVTECVILVGDNIWQNPIEKIFDITSSSPYYKKNKITSSTFIKKRTAYKRLLREKNKNINAKKFLTDTIDTSKPSDEQRKDAISIIESVYEEGSRMDRSKKAVKGLTETPTLEKDVLIEQITRCIFTSDGKKYEQLIFDNIRDGKVFPSDYKITSLTKSSSFKSLPEKLDESLSYIIAGATDGFIETVNDGKCILEIKKRQSRLFTELPIYEIDQAQLYMHFMGYKKTILVQMYNNTYGYFVIEYDEKIVSVILLKLSKILILIQKLSGVDSITYSEFETKMNELKDIDNLI